MISFIPAPDILQCSSTVPGSGTFSGVLGPQEGRLIAASHNSFSGVNLYFAQCGIGAMPV
jgi:hypothetical protein